MKLFLRILLFIAVTSANSLAQPDTTVNRYATSEDAAYWNNVNEGDYIFFTGNINDGESIYAGGSVFSLSLPLGKKILIWRGSYRRILIDGTKCASNPDNPTIITNLGGQVKWGYSEANNQYRTLELLNFDHVYLSGKYDPEMQTGHQDFLGHDNGNAYDSGDFHEKYGLWGNPKWSGVRFFGSFSNVVRIRGFESLKIDYVAATEGGFAGFNIKTDNPATPKTVYIDIQDCFAGWVESEGFYISYSTSAAGQDLTKLTFKNNIMAFCGSESLQTDNLIEGTVIENNIAFAGAAFHRRPFQDNFQDGLHQFSFSEGDVTVQNNVMITGNSLHQMRYKDPGPGRVNPSADKKVLMKNNFYGFSRSNISYVWNGDGITPYEIDGNIYGPVSTPTTRDGYNDYMEWDHYFRICNSNTVIDIKNIMFPGDRPLYEGYCGTDQVTISNISEEIAPLIEFENSGFNDDQDYRNITFWSAEYGTADKEGEFIPYEIDDIVFYYDNNSGETRFYKCIQAHSGNNDPNNSPAQWEELQWSGKRLPPLDLRMSCDSFYDGRNMGLTYKACSLGQTEDAYLSNELIIYPNPAKEFVSVRTNKAEDVNTIIDIININGQVITTQSLLNDEKIDVSFLPTGIYFLKARWNGNEVTEKLIKE